MCEVAVLRHLLANLRNWPSNFRSLESLVDIKHNLQLVLTLTFEEVGRDARSWQAVSDWTSRRERPATIPRMRNFWGHRSGATLSPSVAPNFDYLENKTLSLTRSI